MSAAELVAAAERLAARAHAPYSGVRVGAVAEDARGVLHGGVNVESGSLGLTLCAERAALARAVADGAAPLVAVGVGRADGAPIVPCGACRQLLHELAPAARVAHRAGDGEVRERAVAELLPEPFSLPPA
jgi:cytidine deaminase